MRIKEISYLLPPKDLINDCLEISVRLEDNFCTDEFFYTVKVTTPQFLGVLMGENNFLPPDYPFIIVSKLTNDIVKSAIQAFIDEENDAFWLKLYNIMIRLDIEDINEILDCKKKQIMELAAKENLELDVDD